MVNPVEDTAPVFGDSTLWAAKISASALGTLLDNVFTGEPAGSLLQSSNLACPSSSQIPQIHLSVCVPFGASVSSKLELKIWNNEFVDIKNVLPTSGEEPHSIVVQACKIELQQAASNKSPSMDRCFSDI